MAGTLLERPLHSFPEPTGVGVEVPERERDRARGVMAQEGAHVGRGWVLQHRLRGRDQVVFLGVQVDLGRG